MRMKMKMMKKKWRSVGKCWSSILSRNSLSNSLLRLLNFTLLISALSPQSQAQTGFISIDCGGEGTTPYTDKSTRIQWQPDGTLMTIGSTSKIKDPTVLELETTAKPLTTLRYFPDTKINKFCYELGPVTIDSVYLVRASFLHGNYNGNNEVDFSFDLLLEADVWDSINVRNTSQKIETEVYMSAQRSNVSICVARTIVSYDPFISSLEVRPITPNTDQITAMKTRNVLLQMAARYNLGALTDADIRYPDDKYDRIWYARTNGPRIETKTQILAPDFDEALPSLIMQTANDYSDYRSMEFNFYNLESGTYFIQFYFAELNASVGIGDRVFNISMDGILFSSEPLDIFSLMGGQSFKTSGYFHSSWKISKSTLVVALNATSSSLLGPLWNAFELFRYSDTLTNTTSFSDDVETLSIVKKSLGLNNWTGDPCMPLSYPYTWVNCSLKATLRRVTSLILPNMNLQGSLPPRIDLLNELTEINLEGNRFTGNIPKWASLTKLEILKLQHNNLSGTIPDFLGDLPALIELSLQYNNFIGEIPANIQAKVSSAQLKLHVDGNPNLCGNQCTTSKNNVATIVGITGATLLIFLIIFLLYRFACCKPAPIPGPIQSNDGNHNNRAPEERKGMLFSYEDIISATENFRNVIGKGGFGMVFYGTWNGAPVAVKVLSQNSEQGRREFLNEVEILSTVHHRNLVTLVGYCQSPKLVLVYEYLSGGSLRDHINESTLHSLPWRTRLHIALDAAQALEYLHASCEPRIIHGDVKSSNILLNENMQAKFGDFGLSRIHKDDTTDVATFNLRGTRGYVDPVYSSTMTLNEKSDVYSFGVILLEIISGRAPFDLRHPEVERNLADWAHIHFQEGVELETMMDGRIRENNYNISAVWKIMEIAMGCVKYIRLERPDMGGVVIGLKEALSIEEGGGMEISCLDKSLVGDLKLNEVRAR